MKRTLGVLWLIGVAGVLAVGCSSADSGDGKPAAIEAPTAAPVPPAADELMIDEVAVYQAVKATIVKEGALVEPAKINAPIIAGRPAYVRVFVKGIGHTRPTIEGELRVKRAGKADLVVTDRGRKVVPELDDSLLENTLNFEIPAEDMTADASFSFRTAVKLDSPVPSDILAFPADGKTIPFGAKTASQKLKVKFVPVSYEAVTGTSITPDLGDIATLKDTIYKMYPVASVEMTIREPIKWSSVVKASGSGWDELLSGIMQIRRVDQVERDVYYVGVFTPEPSLDQFCNQGGCILGIAPMASETNVGMRAALVLGYKNRSAGSTLAQELAHAMGRLHAPCGSPAPGSIDDDFPYSAGGIGVWGWDVVKKELVDPGNRYRDFMSYCGPTWTSDYTFKGIYDRMALITKQQLDAPPPGGSGTPPGSGGSGGAMQSQIMQSFRVATDGSVHEGPDLEVLPGDGSGEHTVVSYEGKNGKIFATAKAQVHTISGTGSHLVVAPKAPAGAMRAHLAGLGVSVLRTR